MLNDCLLQQEFDSQSVFVWVGEGWVVFGCFTSGGVYSCLCSGITHGGTICSAEIEHRLIR